MTIHRAASLTKAPFHSTTILPSHPSWHSTTAPFFLSFFLVRLYTQSWPAVSRAAGCPEDEDKKKKKKRGKPGQAVTHHFDEPLAHNITVRVVSSGRRRVAQDSLAHLAEVRTLRYFPNRFLGAREGIETGREAEGVWAETRQLLICFHIPSRPSSRTYTYAYIYGYVCR
ncbi:hypothetical protein GGS23DRAFT_14472 [Durotheca rogersii]|uniref:uncharacterized protein n=1 Tax=Durotheca rogersii TaxID=419775 RepID=UPI00221F2EC7|nr:uncharacterized protein GGS23DRAFT_14472 [Durotheca rogersii]KAI5868146.1 hypothetical protein GGS23DRAFT_14472 [Durotheca rogersii]